MPLIVGPDGQITEGPIPPGESTKVIALVGGQYREVWVTNNAGGGGGSVVEREALRYDNLTTAPTPVESTVLVTGVSEHLPAILEEVVAAILARSEEAAPTPAVIDRITATALALDETMPAPMDVAAVVGAVTETMPTAVDAARLTLVATEQPPAPADALTLAASVSEIAPTATDDAATRLTVTEAMPTPVDSVAVIAVALSEVAPAPTTTEVPLARVIAPETAPLSVDTIGLVAVQATDAPLPIEVSTLAATLTSYANAVVSNTNWANPTQALGNAPSDYASLSAASSGLLGTTSNTTTGTLVVGIADPILSDLTINTVVAWVAWGIAVGGVPISGRAASVSYQVSVDNGATWTTVTSSTATANQAASTTFSLDITALVAGDWSRVNALQIRATGTVTSGTGVSVTITYGLTSAWVVVTAGKAY